MAKGMDGDETQGREPMESEANKGYSVMMPRDAAVRGVVEIQLFCFFFFFLDFWCVHIRRI